MGYARAMTRRQYRADLRELRAEPVVLATEFEVRNPCEQDVDTLATLVLEGYRGTPDDEGEDLAQARDFVTSILTSEALREASWVAIDPHGVAVAAVAIQRWRGQPLVAFVVTHPNHQRGRLARSLTQRAMNALAANQEETLIAFITEGNTPSERLFTGLGFRRL